MPKHLEVSGIILIFVALTLQKLMRKLMQTGGSCIMEKVST